MGKEYCGQLQLASKGFCYDGKLPDGVLNVEPWGTAEERLLVSPSIPFSEIVSRLIKKLTDCPIDPKDLLLIDRWHIFIYMRCLSYGSEYSYNFKCENCSSKNRTSINLEKDLDVIYSDDKELLAKLGVTDLSEPFDLVFPISKRSIKWRMLRGSDELATDKYVSRLQQSVNKRLPEGEDPGYSFRLARRIVEIDGTEVEISDAIDFVDSLKGKDSLAFRQAIYDINIGVNQELLPRCTNCGWENEVVLPVDKTFFRPER